jgi:serine/threonine protein kinase
MEHIESPTLARTIRIQGTLPFETVLGIGIHAVRGLSAGLEQGLVHRDIKPANILLTKSGEAKIVDLGLALLHTALTTTSDGRMMPRRSGVVGTQGYISPERSASPDRVDFRADIYSLGVTLYHALVARLPFVRRIAAATRGDEEPDLSRLPVIPAAPTGFAVLLSSMMDPDPRRRPGSYEELLSRMQSVGESAAHQ